MSAHGRLGFDDSDRDAGVTLKQLRELMEFRGAEGVDKIREQGGVNELCKNLRTSEKSGE